MNSTIWTSDVWQRVQHPSCPRHIQYWLSVVGVALADGLSFLLVNYAVRYGHNVPMLLMFPGSNAATGAVPVNVFALLGTLFVIVRYLAGDYSRRQLFWDGARITTVALIATSVPDLIMLLLSRGAYSPWPVLFSWFCLLCVLPVIRQCARVLMSRMKIWQIPAAVIGVGARTAEIYKALQSSLSMGFDARWLIIENPALSVPEELARLKPIHSAEAAQIAAMLCANGCKEAVITAEEMQSEHLSEVVRRLLEANISVTIVPSISRLPLANATTSYLFGSDILLMRLSSNARRLPSRILKRGFDIVISFLLLVFLFPLFLAIALAIHIDSPGPATYAQRRVGRHGTQFRCLKFRTMARNADEILERWKSENPELYREFLVTFKLRDDPRVTRMGKWLRRTSLDEFPQLLNVLKGDMSLVGPRPVPEQQLRDQYQNAAQLYVQVRPGISGLWQISGRSETTSDQRIILDEWYILNWSFWYDIVILVKTAWIVATGKGAY